MYERTCKINSSFGKGSKKIKKLIIWRINWQIDLNNKY